LFSSRKIKNKKDLDNLEEVINENKIISENINQSEEKLKSLLSISDLLDSIKEILKDVEEASNSPFVLDQKHFLNKQNVSYYKKEINFPYKLSTKKDKPMSPMDLGNRTCYVMDNNYSIISKIDIKIVDNLIKGELENVFASYKNRKNKTKIIKTFNKIINQYEVSSKEDYVNKRNMIIEYIDLCRSSSPLVYTSVKDTQKLHRKIRFAEKVYNPLGSDILKNVNYKYFKDYSEEKKVIILM